MRILILSPWYSEKMGYAENYLPSALGKLGNEVHLVTTDLQVYATNPDYNKVYFRHLGPPQVNTGITKYDYFTLHRCNNFNANGIAIKDLDKKLKTLKPDIVYLFEIIGRDFDVVVRYRDELHYKVFAESRLHLSVFNRPASFTQRIHQFKAFVKGRYLSRKVSCYYPVAPDVQFVISKYFGIPSRKCKLASLAVDVDRYKPLSDEAERFRFRNNFGYLETDIVCLYTGRFDETKNPIVLAKAIDHLNAIGHSSFKAHFVGNGDEPYINSVLSFKGSAVTPFVEAKELVKFYQSFDIGVWPSQESTSQLDALACGMPIILSDHVKDVFRIQNNGLTYRDLDHVDLANQLLKLSNQSLRKSMGKFGHEKITNFYSWDFLAKNKLVDFNAV